MGGGGTPGGGPGLAPTGTGTVGGGDGGGVGVNAPLAFGGTGSSLGSLIGLPQAGSVSPEEQSWADFVRGQNVTANAQAFGPGLASSTMHTMADIGAQAGEVLQIQRINDAMKAASQEFANAQKGALGGVLGGIGSALGGITRLAGI